MRLDRRNFAPKSEIKIKVNKIGDFDSAYEVDLASSEKANFWSGLADRHGILQPSPILGGW